MTSLDYSLRKSIEKPEKREPATPSWIHPKGQPPKTTSVRGSPAPFFRFLNALPYRLAEKFCTFINLSGIKALEDTKTNIELNYKEFKK